MTYTRHQLAAALSESLDAAAITNYLIVPDPRELGEPDPAIEMYLQIVRQRVAPAPSHPRGAYEESHELWLIEPTNPDPVIAEDLLDDKLAIIIEILDAGLSLDGQRLGVSWSSAERGIHKSNRHGYKFTLTLTTDRTPE